MALAARDSDDNAFSEAKFKTLKYHPGFLRRSASKEEAEACCRAFFPWYNYDHRSSGIATLAPAGVYFGRADDLLGDRQEVLAGVYRNHPARMLPA